MSLRQRQEAGLDQILLARLEHERTCVAAPDRRRSRSRRRRWSSQPRPPRIRRTISPASSAVATLGRRVPRGRRSRAFPRRRWWLHPARESGRRLRESPRSREDRPGPFRSARRPGSSAIDAGDRPKERIDGRAAGIFVRVLVDLGANPRALANDNEVIIAGRRPRPCPAKVQFPNFASTVGMCEFLVSRSASICVNIGGMCCTTRIGTGRSGGSSSEEFRPMR